MGSVELQDFARVVEFLSDAADPTRLLTLQDRRRLLMSSVARFIDADIWMLTTGVDNPDSPGDAMLTQSIDDGFDSNEERAVFVRISLDPRLAAAVQAPIAELILSGQNATFLRSQLISDDNWVATAVAKQWTAAGFGDFILTAVAIPHGHSSAGFHRRANSGRSTQQHADVLREIFQNVTWLHDRIKNTASAGNTLMLSPRERQVLVLLLDGSTRKQIADTLRLSRHTIVDYLKVIYRKLGVKSQRELIAKFARSI